MQAGDVITEDCLSVKSPGDGLPVKHLDLIIGKRLIKSVKKDYPISWDLFFNS